MVDGLMPLVVIDPAGVMEEARFLGRGIQKDGHLSRVRHLPRRDQGELVQQALGVLHYADDGLPALRPGVAHRELSSEASPGVMAT